MSKEHSATGTSTSEQPNEAAASSKPSDTPKRDAIFGQKSSPVVEVVPVTTTENEVSAPEVEVAVEVAAGAPVQVTVTAEKQAETKARLAEADDDDFGAADAAEMERAMDEMDAIETGQEPKSEAKPEVKKFPKGKIRKIEPGAKVEDDEEEMSDPAEPAGLDPFQKLGLRDDVYKAIAGFGYTEPTAIQAETVKIIMDGRDVIGQAETGSGKTAAFAWPLLSKIDLANAAPQILVLAPTRELAIQVSSAFEKYGSSMKGLKTVTIYGGQSYETQFRALTRGVHVVVGTPGRVMDHLNRGTLKLNNIKTFVLDEADEMLRMGFIDDVQWVMERLPEQRQVVSFSATMPAPIRNIAKKYLKDPAHITIKSKTATADSISQSYAIVNVREKLKQLCWLLETEETDGVLVFVKTRQTTNVVAEHLANKGFDAAALNGDIAQNQRERTVNRLKAGKIDIVVATDVAARGLDVKRVSHVINYDFPHDSEIYVHRIGRTGRAGRSGEAIMFVEPKEKRKLGWLEKDTKQKIALYKPKSVKDVNQQRVDKFREKVVEMVDHKEVKFFKTLVESIVEKSEHSVETIAAVLAVMAQGTTPLLLTEADKSGGRNDGKKRGRTDHDKASYRIEVGRNHGVGPGNIVGAIANEGGFQNGEIGRVKLFDSYSIVDLPANLPDDLMDVLRNVSVSGQRLQISKSDNKWSDSGSGRPRRNVSKSNNGSTNFVKRQRAERDKNKGGGSGGSGGGRGNESGGYRGRKSISESPTFSDKPQHGEQTRRPARGKAPYSPVATSAAKTSQVKSEGKSSGGGKAKPVKKYIKVRTRK